MNIYNTIEEVKNLGILPPNSLVNEDCLEAMKLIEDGSVDLICADLPYAMTARNPWDKEIILFEPLWEQYERVIKDDGAILLFSAGIFTAKLMLSNEKLFRYDIIWEKTTSTGFLNSKRMVLRSHENIACFYKKLPTYNPQKTTGHVRKVSSSTHKRNSKQTTNYGEYGLTSYDSTERYPKSVWKFSTDKQKSKLSPTQKPVKLLEELIKTYSNEGDLVLDNVMGSGSTIVACQNLNRHFIGIEKDPEMFAKASDRIQGNQGRIDTVWNTVLTQD